jgi:hypothetical protein
MSVYLHTPVPRQKISFMFSYFVETITRMIVYNSVHCASSQSSSIYKLIAELLTVLLVTVFETG